MNLLLGSPINVFIAELIDILYDNIGNFGWTVVFFSLILKVALSPIDYWQKKVTWKNNKAMKKMKPQLEKLQRQYGSNRETYNVKQMELYKKEGYSMMGACLPMLITLAVFFTLFGGFREVVRMHNEDITYELAELHNAGATDEELADKYEELMEGWLWVNNVFMPDTWADIVPSKEAYSGSGLGKIDAEMPDNYNELGDYNSLVQPAIDRLNSDNFMEGWNGLLILPILSVIVNFLSILVSKGQQPEQPIRLDGEGKPINNQASAKMMQYSMPIMMGVFAFMYSTAFTIYIITSAIFTLVFNLGFNIIAKAKDAKEEKIISYSRR